MSVISRRQGRARLWLWQGVPPGDGAFSAWEQQATLMNEGTTLSWSDPAPGATVKFYRIQRMP